MAWSIIWTPTTLLHTIFERIERQGSRMGMNIDEFKQFELQLPDDYRQRFDRMVCII